MVDIGLMNHLLGAMGEELTSRTDLFNTRFCHGDPVQW